MYCRFLIVLLLYLYLDVVTIVSSVIATTLQCSAWLAGPLLFDKEGRFITRNK